VPNDNVIISNIEQGFDDKEHRISH